ncbi:MAG: gliding motility-associated C-terminal domain-containing protein [Daejeonella sp.]
MKKTICQLITILIVSISASQAKAQLYNSGQTITLSDNSMLYVNGNINNATNIAGGGFGNSGTIQLTGDWINDNDNQALISSGIGKVIFSGDNQKIGGTQPTRFYNLELAGTGIKTQEINQIVEGTLSLNDRELATDNFVMSIVNPSVNAVAQSTGFVSSRNGYLERSTNSSSNYLFPVGSSLNTVRYSPVNIKPVLGSSNTYGVRLKNNNPTADGFDVAKKETNLESINSNYYHHITRGSGNSAADITFYYNEAEGFKTLAGWDAGKPEWKNVSPITTSGNLPVGFNASMTKPNWNEFNTTTELALADGEVIPPPIPLTIYTGIITTAEYPNNIFLIKGTENYPNLEVDVYNRWGNQVFHTKGYNITANMWKPGNEIAAGTYYYIVKLNDGKNTPPLVGYLTLINQ